VATVVRTFHDAENVETAAGQPGPNPPSAGQGDVRDREAPGGVQDPVIRRRREKAATRSCIEWLLIIDGRFFHSAEPVDESVKPCGAEGGVSALDAAVARGAELDAKSVHTL
jgi:hypothetical protein